MSDRRTCRKERAKKEGLILVRHGRRGEAHNMERKGYEEGLKQIVPRYDSTHGSMKGNTMIDAVMVQTDKLKEGCGGEGIFSKSVTVA